MFSCSTELFKKLSYRCVEFCTMESSTFYRRKMDTPNPNYPTFAPDDHTFTVHDHITGLWSSVGLVLPQFLHQIFSRSTVHYFFFFLSFNGKFALRSGHVTSSNGLNQEPWSRSTGYVVSVPGLDPARMSSWVPTSKSDGMTELNGLVSSTHPI